MKRAQTRAAPPVKTPKRPTPLDAIPRVVTNATLDDHLEIITRAIFQAGLSWSMIGDRWDTFCEAFESFEVAKVAGYGDVDLERLMATEKIVHSRKKIAGTIENARTLVAIEREFGSIATYIGGFSRYALLFADAHRRFAFMGDLNCYYWLFRTANPVPQFDDWIARQTADHPRMREMVLLARGADASSERSGF